MNQNRKHVSFYKFNFGLTSFRETRHRCEELWLELTKTINKERPQIPVSYLFFFFFLLACIPYASKLVSADLLEVCKIYGVYDMVNQV